MKNPTPYEGKKDKESQRYEDVHTVKRLDCAFYNECLTEAVDKKWPNFGCGSCDAYEALDIDQKVQDVLGLLAARQAAKNVVEMGRANRTRGVKPGVDAKTRKKTA